MLSSVASLSANDIKMLEEFLLENAFANIYLLSDLENKDKRCKVAFHSEKEKIDGVVFKVEFSDFPFFWIIGSSTAADSLAQEISGEKFALTTEENLLPIITKMFPGAKVFSEFVMHVSTKDAVSVHNVSVRSLGQEDVQELSTSFMPMAGRPPPEERSREMITDNDSFGNFFNGEIVSRGQIDAKSEHGWAIGRIFTKPEFRNRGFATTLVSSIVQYASRETDDMVLYVRKDNRPAITSYKKIGFKAVCVRYFVDFNTGVVP